MKFAKQKQDIIFYLCLALTAVLVCVGMYGADILNPTDIHIYHRYGDGMQHYYGWIAYRNSPWQFPLGLFNGVTYPDSTSIIFTDSLPLFAVIFKILSPLLPAHFQYFGLWTMLCFILQTVIAAHIFRRVTDDRVFILFASLLFLFVPSMLCRAFSHEALGGQWLVLLAYELFLCVARESDTKKILFRAALLGFLAASTHIYFLPICGMIVVGCALEDMLRNQRRWRAVGLLMGYLSAAAFAVYLYGGFSTTISVSTENFRYGNMANLNTLWNALTFSRIFPAIPLFFGGQDDGSAYLGAGFFVLFAAVLVLGLRKIFPREKQTEILSKASGTHRPEIISLTIVGVLALWFSTYPLITINDTLLFSTKCTGLFRIVDRAMSVFRCSGRGIWVISYGLMLYILLTLAKTTKRHIGKQGLPQTVRNRIPVILLVFCLALQIFDLSGYVRTKYENLHEETEETKLFAKSDEINELIATKNVKHIVIDKSVNGVSAMFAASWAIENGLTVNAFYLARSDEAAYEKRLANALAHTSKDTLYLFARDANARLDKTDLTEHYRTKTFLVGY